MVMSQIVAFVFIIIGIGTIVSASYVGKKAKNEISDLKSVINSKNSKIEDIGKKDMMQSISGVARLHKDTVNTPLKGSEVIGYESKITMRSGVTSTKIYSDERAEIFRLISGDKSVLIDPTHADLRMNKSIVPVNLTSVQNIVANESLGVSMNDLRATEGVINDGDPVFIYGNMEELGDRHSDKRVGGKSDKNFIISNEDKSDLKRRILAYSLMYVGMSIALISAGLSVIAFAIL